MVKGYFIPFRVLGLIYKIFFLFTFEQLPPIFTLLCLFFYYFLYFEDKWSTCSSWWLILEWVGCGWIDLHIWWIKVTCGSLWLFACGLWLDRFLHVVMIGSDLWWFAVLACWVGFGGIGLWYTQPPKGPLDPSTPRLFGLDNCWTTHCRRALEARLPKSLLACQGHEVQQAKEKLVSLAEGPTIFLDHNILVPQ